HCFRIRERILRLNKQLTGSRLLRGIVAPGGLARDVSIPTDLPSRVEAAVSDFEEIVAVCLNNTLVLDRLEGTGVLNIDLARDYGVLGFVARASGIDTDARRDHPFAAYPQLSFSVPVLASGDVKARALVRVDGVDQSTKLVRQACGHLTPGRVRAAVAKLDAFAPAFGIVEGWRGRIVHWVVAGDDGTL